MNSDDTKMKDSGKKFHSIASSPFGEVALIWSVCEEKPKIRQILLSRPGIPAREIVGRSFSDAPPSSCPEIKEAGDRIEAFLSGEDIRFSLDRVRLDLCSDFQQRVLRAEHGIPRGRVSTYRRIALFLDRPSAARAVGSALANNPFPIIIPCHRAIRSDRSLGGYQGGLVMKRALLEMEGLGFDLKGRVETEEFFY